MNTGSALLGPAVFAALAWFISFRLWRRKRIHETGTWGGALAVGGGFIVGYVALVGLPQLKPEGAFDWLPLIALIAMIPSVFHQFWGDKIYKFVPVVAVIATLTVWLQAFTRIRYRWQPSEAMLWIGGAGIFIAIVAWNLEVLSRRRQGASMPAALLIYSVLASIILRVAGSGLLANQMAALAACMIVALIFSWWNPQFALSQGALTVFSILFFGLILQGYWYAEMRTVSLFVTISAPFFLWYGESRKIFYMKPSKAVLWRMGLVAVPMFLALLIGGYDFYRDGR